MRLVTYNIHKGIGGTDRRYDLARIQRVLAECRPDLVCLQEVAFGMPRLKAHDQAHLLAEGLPELTPFFQPTVHWKKGGGYGNLMLSRWPLAEPHRISLRQGQKKIRGAQCALVETPQGTLRLANWHLGLAEGERQWQAAHLLAHEVWRHSARWPTVLIGDTNDWRNQLGAKILGPHGLHQASAPPSRFRSFPAQMPVLSIDKVFHCPGVVVRNLHVVSTRLTRRASDHLPVMVELGLKG